MAVANHPLCEPVRFAHYKAPEDINTYEPLYRGRRRPDLTLEPCSKAAR